MRTLFLILITCLFVLPAYAKYSGGIGEPNDPYQIATAADLIALGEDPNDYGKHFILTADIDLDPNLPGRKVFDKAVIAPGTYSSWYGFVGTPFTGVFDGNGRRISHLTVTGTSCLGLFGRLFGIVSDLGIVNVNITGSGDSIGGLAGTAGLRYAQTGALTHCCYSTGAVNGSTNVGGLVGSNSGTVTHCYSTSAARGNTSFGGPVGGLVGENYGTVSNSYNSGVVSGPYSIGGLVGHNWGGSTVAYCYSTGAVSGDSHVGGLVGRNEGAVRRCYSAGVVVVSGNYKVGGLVGYNDSGSVIGSFWDIQTSGQAASDGGTGVTTPEMQNIQTYQGAGWDFAGEIKNGLHEIWQMPQGGGYPVLAILSGYTPPQLQGSGTPGDPYLISDAVELGAMYYYNPSSHCRLAASIDLSGIHWDMAVIPRFSGTFDGNNHTISHLTIEGESHLGLFGQLQFGAEVRNLGIVDVNITGSEDYVGALAACINIGAGVAQCYGTGTVRGRSCVGGLLGYNWGAVSECYTTGAVGGRDQVGGLVGENYGGNVTRCYSTVAVSGDEYSVGGLVGRNWGAVSECYSTGAVSGKSEVGGLVGANWDTVTHCYSTGATTGASCVGGLVGANEEEFFYSASGAVMRCYSTGVVDGNDRVGGLVGTGEETNRVTDSFWDIQTSGQPTSAGGTGKGTAEMQDPNTFRAAGWDFVGPADGPSDIWAIPQGGGYPILWWQLAPWPSLPKFAGGTGEPNDPYRISTPKDLNGIGYNPRLMKCHFKLVADLDLTGLLFYPIGSEDNRYGGVFDGNAHAVAHLTITGGNYVGLFGWLEGKVKDLGVVDANIVGSGAYVGGLAGCSTGDATNCYSTGTVNGGESVGGLVGYLYGGPLAQCYSTGAVSGTSCIGGVVGSSSTGSNVTECYSTGAVMGESNVGGLVGANGGYLVNCHSIGPVSGTESVGGLVGINAFGFPRANGHVIECYSSGAVSGSWYVGGLVGFNSVIISNCYSTGSVSGDDYVGGLVGENDAINASVVHCYSTGAVNGSSNVGGLTGSSSYGPGGMSSVTASFWDTETSSQTTSAGGTGKTTAEMQTANTFLDAGWDFMGETANGTDDIWWILEGKDYPRLWWER